jgi:hypothetical protein
MEAINLNPTEDSTGDGVFVEVLLEQALRPGSTLMSKTSQQTVPAEVHMLSCI